MEVGWIISLYPVCSEIHTSHSHFRPSPVNKENVVLHPVVSVRFNPFALKSDQYQISPAASPEILDHTVWRTWLFIAYSDARRLYYQFSLPSVIQFSLQGWENVLFQLGSERVKRSPFRDRTRRENCLSPEAAEVWWCQVNSRQLEKLNREKKYSILKNRRIWTSCCGKWLGFLGHHVYFSPLSVNQSINQSINQPLFIHDRDESYSLCGRVVGHWTVGRPPTTGGWNTHDPVFLEKLTSQTNSLVVFVLRNLENNQLTCLACRLVMSIFQWMQIQFLWR